MNVIGSQRGGMYECHWDTRKGPCMNVMGKNDRACMNVIETHGMGHVWMS